MVMIQRIDMRELDKRKGFHFKLPMIYYHTPPVFPIESAPQVEYIQLEGVPAGEKMFETFKRLGINHQRQGIGVDCVMRPMGLVEELHIIPDEANRRREDVIIPDDIAWGELMPWMGRARGRSQTDFYPVGIANRDQIAEFLSTYGRREH